MSLHLVLAGYRRTPRVAVLGDYTRADAHRFDRLCDNG